MYVHLFGASSSLSIANYALRRVVHGYKVQRSANTLWIIKEGFYVDDFLHSENNMGSLVDTVHELKYLYKYK